MTEPRTPVSRRRFMTQTASGATAVALAAPLAHAANRANRKVVVGVMGMSRGRSLALGFSQLEDVEVKYCCDADEDRAGRGAAELEKRAGKAPQAIQDYREILDDKDVDVLVCAAPNHWHAPATIMACKAGKHAYSEKPCSHNPWEGEQMILAARAANRGVQIGTQRRSGPTMAEAMQRLHEGVIGRVYEAQCWYTNQRGPIGVGKPASPPEELDYELWQGPAPRVPYMDNRIHYNWHWFWQWGNGELGNNGVHTLDICRWGLDVDYPIQVASIGGRWHFEDDQQTPDTHTVGFVFEDRKSMTWQGHSCNRHPHRKGQFVTFYGDNGTMEVDGNGGYVIFDPRDKELENVKASSRGDREHMQNLVDAIRNDTPTKLNAEVEEGHKSTLLCHLGNIAHRVGHTLHCSAADGKVQHNEDAMKLWKRDYAASWESRITTKA